MEPQDYEAWLAGGRVDEHAGAERRAAVHGARVHHVPQAGRAPAAGRRSSACSAARCTLADGRTVVADDNYLRESIVNSQAKVVQGFQPIMPAFQGHGERREAAAAHRVHQVAEAGAGAPAN